MGLIIRLSLDNLIIRQTDTLKNKSINKNVIIKNINIFLNVLNTKIARNVSLVIKIKGENRY